MTALKLESISRSFGTVQVLKDFSLTVDEGEFIAIQGASGSGKSTLLNIIGLLDKMDSGKMEHFEQPSPKPYSQKSRKVLHDDIGYLFQNFALLENKSVRYNLEMALDHPKSRESNAKIQEALKRVGLEGFEKKKVAECSGGEQQRIAMARLLLKQARLILADEPTANLDPGNRDMVLELLEEMRKEGRTIIMVTHDHDLALKADRIVTLDSTKA